ncbi:MAG: HD domain-containing protein [Candidatus Bathyarchaeota archaeon]
MSFEFVLPYKDNNKLERIVGLIKDDIQLQTFWRCSNIMAIDRLSYTDHGPTHVKIVANSALKILRILVGKGVVPNVVEDYNLTVEDAEVIVVLGSVLHDLGMIVARENHEMYSVFIAYDFIRRNLNSVYTVEESSIICSEVLHTVLAHHPDQQVLTLEAGIVRVADALDMEQGRARIPFESGKVDIHSVSALSIEQVEILEGKEKPIVIRVKMANSAGIFQVDELLKARIQNSGLEKHIHVIAEIMAKEERKIIEKFEI